MMEQYDEVNVMKNYAIQRGVPSEIVSWTTEDFMKAYIEQEIFLKQE